MDNYTAIGYLEGLRRFYVGSVGNAETASDRNTIKALQMAMDALAAEQAKLDEAEDAEYSYTD